VSASLSRVRHRLATTETARRSRRWLAAETAKLSDRLAGAPPGLPPSSFPLPTDEYELEVDEWTVFHSRLFARFRLTPGPMASPPERVILILPDTTIDLPTSTLSGEGTEVVLPEGLAVGLRLGFVLADGRFVIADEPAAFGLSSDPGGRLFGRFASELRSRPPGRVLEIGSRARSGTVYRGALVPDSWDYTGLDIRDGPNVDIVGDAHDLVATLVDQRFDAVFSLATFEHVAMPWKAAVAINEILEDGGLVYVGSHQAFPMHERPWDFWRYSDQAWRALFNETTGFEVVDVALGEPANVVATFSKDALTGTDGQPAFLTSGVIAQKVGPSTVEWAVPLDRIVSEVYPR
jgi:hypothetical protein